MLRLRPLLLVPCLLLTGCFSKGIVTPMKESTVPATSAPSGKARLLVVRPGRMAGKLITHHVTDADQTFLGDAFNDSVFAADLSPGDHQLCIGNPASAGPMIEAKLAAGKTYVVRVDLSLSYPKLVPIKPGTDDLKEVMVQLPGIRGAELLGPTAQDAPTAEDLKGIYDRCKKATEDISPAEKNGYILNEADAI